MRPAVWIGAPVLAAIVLTGVWWGVSNDGPRSAAIGKPLPELRLEPIEGLAGSGVSVSGRSGKTMIVNAFASWCLPCRAEHPLFLEIASRYDVLLVGMNVADLPEGAVAFLEELGNPYDLVGADPHRENFTALGFVGMPHTLVVSPDGVVQFSHPGPINEDFGDTLLPGLIASK